MSNKVSRKKGHVIRMTELVECLKWGRKIHPQQGKQ